MKTLWRPVALLVAVAAIGLVAATAAAAVNPHQRYTCVRVTENGNEVRVNVPERAVPGLTRAGFTCFPNDPADGEDPGDEDGAGPASTGSDVQLPQGQRSLYCSTNGPVFRANGDGMGIALNLLDDQGALMVQMGLVTPAIFYQGIGASCDVLPGFENSGIWVDHVGDVVPGVALYPLFVPASAG